MNKHPRFVTLSKYPPYRSGHAKQALWNNTALAALTGAEQHQVTYCGVSADPEDDAGAGSRSTTLRKCAEIAGCLTGICCARSRPSFFVSPWQTISTS